MTMSSYLSSTPCSILFVGCKNVFDRFCFREVSQYFHLITLQGERGVRTILCGGGQFFGRLHCALCCFISRRYRGERCVTNTSSPYLFVLQCWSPSPSVYPILSLFVLWRYLSLLNYSLIGGSTNLMSYYMSMMCHTLPNCWRVITFLIDTHPFECIISTTFSIFPDWRNIRN